MAGPSEFVGNAQLVIDRFGEWPSFHDAEVMRLSLDRNGRVLTLELMAFTMLDEVDDRGYFKHANQSLVTLRFAGINDVSLEGFNEQNVISGLFLTKDDDALKVVVSPLYGLSTEFSCARADVERIEGLNDREV